MLLVSTSTGMSIIVAIVNLISSLSPADVSANLKNKVTKTNAQKVLQLLAGKLSILMF